MRLIATRLKGLHEKEIEIWAKVAISHHSSAKDNLSHRLRLIILQRWLLIISIRLLILRRRWFLINLRGKINEGKKEKRNEHNSVILSADFAVDQQSEWNDGNAKG